MWRRVSMGMTHLLDQIAIGPGAVKWCATKHDRRSLTGCVGSRLEFRGAIVAAVAGESNLVA